MCYGRSSTRCTTPMSSRATCRQAPGGQAPKADRTMTRDDVPKLPRGVRLHFDGVRQAHVLLAPERAFNVNKTAVAVLQLIDGRRSVGDIVVALGREFK